ncbi:hypothetical protein GALMADRAFT_248614 [Galerina marginata CBS 339.88]|uniref:ubiquitinyl hydrolase 1 n=1 Tax=Galerina marginata (strain CBS 339.88) TaxID=685588 RepID=A0A067SY50_GALM3|nr:hypothetical protein GALMADRAFT_248614 [Galerina marginata CBS 339.88]
MAGLERLIPNIYHEKQQSGSMLCAQHALNSLLQGNYFTAPDLSDIARTLDALEESYDDSNTGNSSTNMDDTGFFSVQVLDNALKVWGLNLTRWRGEDLRPYQDHPQTQLAFILNLEQHWFTLRRFGNANPNIDLDDGNGHWFNLNSFLPAPEWVGKLYLGMVLQQAEAEGYSVFAVTQANPEAPLALPRTEADVIASTLPEPSSASDVGLQIGAYRDSTKKTLENTGSEDVHFEEEDYELQAALQASLMADEHAYDEHTSFPELNASARFLGAWSEPGGESPSGSGYDSGSRTPQFVQPTSADIPVAGEGDLDPIAASMERNRVLLQRMRQQQEFAQREMWSESDLSTEEQAALEERRERRRLQEEEEEAELRRAIEESEALAERHRQESGTAPVQVEATPPSSVMHDDEDDELQAALRASLEYSRRESMEADDAESIVSDVTSGAEEPGTRNTPAPSLDEIRQRRLARFGQ